MTKKEFLQYVWGLEKNLVSHIKQKISEEETMTSIPGSVASKIQLLEIAKL